MSIGSRAFDVLCVLVARRDNVVSKRDLLDQAWPGLCVEENNLSVQISALRKILGTDAISTIAGRGYRFCIPAVPALEDLRLLNDAEQSANQAVRDAIEVDRGILRDSAVGLLVESVEFETGAHALADVKTIIDSLIERAANVHVIRESGTVIRRAGHTLIAFFPDALKASRCALRIQQESIEGPTRWFGRSPGLRVALVKLIHEDESEESFSRRGIPIIQHASIEEIALDPSVAERLTHKVDGNLVDLGSSINGPSDGTERVFALSASSSQMDGFGPAMDLLPTVAVLPFAAFPSTRNAVDLGDVITDQVIALLSRGRNVNVTSRLSTNAFRDRQSDIGQMARLLNARYFVSGRFAQDGRAIRINVELADALTGGVLWTDSIVDRSSAALHLDSDLIARIAQGVMRSIFVQEVSRVRQLALPTLSSHTLMLAGIALLFRFSPTDFDRARSAFETLRARAPRHPAPLAWLARWHLFRIAQGWSPHRAHDGQAALDYASRALEFDADSSLALTMLGSVHTNHLRDLDGAERLYARALESNPNESIAWLQRGNARSFRADGTGAIRDVEKALTLSPLDPARHFYESILASAALTAGQYERAIDAAQSSIARNKSHVSSFRVLAIALAMTNREDEARIALDEVMKHEPGLTVHEFVSRSPAAGFGRIESFGQALHRIGLPLEQLDP